MKRPGVFLLPPWKECWWAQPCAGLLPACAGTQLKTCLFEKHNAMIPDRNQPRLLSQSSAHPRLTQHATYAVTAVLNLKVDKEFIVF